MFGGQGSSGLCGAEPSHCGLMTSTSIPAPPSLTLLPNGVSLLDAPFPSRNVGVILIVRAGSRDETERTAGLAHFLEHLFFKATRHRPTPIDTTPKVTPPAPAPT